MKLVLGSESIFRQQLMRDAGFQFEVIPARINEKNIRDDDAGALVRNLGIAKSKAVLEKIAAKVDAHLYRDAIIITSDQVAVRESDKAILEKPLTAGGLPDQPLAEQYLRSYFDSRVIFVTSLVCYRVDTQVFTTQVVISPVELSPFTEEEITKLVSIGSTYKACGALPTGIPNDPASAIVDRHIVSAPGDPTAVVGLPMQALKQYLRAMGYPVPRLAMPAI